MSSKKPIDYAKQMCDTMMRKFAAADLPPKGRFHYHQGVFLSGMYQTYQLCENEEYLSYIKDWVDACMDSQGNILNYNRGQLDDIQPGVLLFPLCEKYKEDKYRKAIEDRMDIIKEFPRNKEGGFWHKDIYVEQMWLDGLYMAGPICAEYAVRFNKPEFMDIAVEQALLMQEKTLDKKTGLWYHAWDSSGKAVWADCVTGCSPEFWGRSVGWVPVAVLNELDFLDGSHPKYQEMRDLVGNLLMAVCRYQSEDGRWYQVVDKGGVEGNWLENSCSCLFAGALCKAVRMGILPEAYLENARRGYEGVIRSVEEEGEDLLVGNICVGTGVGDYRHYCERPTSTNDLHGAGSFLIMCTECHDIYK